jgi:glycosyltransferase involved in cell wall biosynthesis
MSSPHLVTVASRRDVSRVRVLAESARAAGIEGPVRAVIVDEPRLAVATRLSDNLVMVPPTMVARTTLHQLRVLADSGRALASFLVPWVADGVLREQAAPFVLVSPSTWVGAPLTALIDGARSFPRLVAATTRPATPRPTARNRGLHPSCVVLGPGSEAFTGWWAERSDQAALQLYEGSPLDEAAASVEHDVIRDAGIGVDAWNAADREIRCVEGILTCGDVQLRTFHFDDFDPAQPHLAVDRDLGNPPVLLSQNSALRHLHERYACQLAAYGEKTDSGYAWERLPGGFRLDAASRDAYRVGLAAAYRGGSRVPDPYAAGGVSAFIDFLNGPSPESAGRYSRYVWSLLRTWPDLEYVFPHASTKDRSHFAWWLHRYARTDGPIPAAIVLPGPGPIVNAKPTKHGGVNVAGYLSTDSGLAVSAKRTMDALSAAGVPVEPVTYRRTVSRQDVFDLEERISAPYDLNLVCVTAEQFPLFHSDMGDAFFSKRYTIGYWYWELEVLPEAQLQSLDLVDEVWVATNHVLDAIAPFTDKPVRHMPIPLTEPHPSDRDRASFGLSEGYTFLFAFDFDSVVERKNPRGVIDAFIRAFPVAAGPRLVLKSINAIRWPAETEQIRCAIADRPDISLIDGYFSGPDQAALVAACDCYVSLHRAEGLGLTLADAMALGKPVIATRYSGNIDFMDDANSFLVPFTYTEVPEGTPAYPAGSRWADPDVTEAARIMRSLANDPAAGRRVGVRARQDILGRWTLDRVGAVMRARLLEVGNRALSRP